MQILFHFVVIINELKSCIKFVELDDISFIYFCLILLLLPLVIWNRYCPFEVNIMNVMGLKGRNPILWIEFFEAQSSPLQITLDAYSLEVINLIFFLYL